MKKVLFIVFSIVLLSCNKNSTSPQGTNCNENKIDMCGTNCANNNCIYGYWVNVNNPIDIFSITNDNLIFYTPNNLDVCNIYSYEIIEGSNQCFSNDYFFAMGTKLQSILYLSRSK